MKDDADKTSCHSSRRRGSEHQPGEGFTATRFRKVQILGPPINEHRANRAYGPQITETDAYFGMLEAESISGKGTTMRLRDPVSLCVEDSMRRPRVNLAKRIKRFLRQREIGGKLPLLLIWSAMLKNFLDCKRRGHSTEVGTETTRACDG